MIAQRGKHTENTGSHSRRYKESYIMTGQSRTSLPGDHVNDNIASSHTSEKKKKKEVFSVGVFIWRVHSPAFIPSFRKFAIVQSKRKNMDFTTPA